MFPVISKTETGGYQFIDLLVHCDITTFRREVGDDLWERQRSTGEWVPEYILDDIVSELHDKLNLTQSNLDAIINT